MAKATLLFFAVVIGVAGWARNGHSDVAGRPFLVTLDLDVCQWSNTTQCGFRGHNFGVTVAPGAWGDEILRLDEDRMPAYGEKQIRVWVDTVVSSQEGGLAEAVTLHIYGCDDSSGGNCSFPATASFFSAAVDSYDDAGFVAFILNTTLGARRVVNNRRMRVVFPGQVVQPVADTDLKFAQDSANGRTTIGAMVPTAQFLLQPGGTAAIGLELSFEVALDCEEGINSDGDTMPDCWEVVNELDPDADDTGGDADGDRYTNLTEFEHGTLADDPDSRPQPLPGDLDFSEVVDMADAILAFQIATGTPVDRTVYVDAEVNSDRRIGMEEGLFILHQLSN
jgi:hypothetical protein